MHNILKLKKDTEYSIQVKASNACGESKPCLAVSPFVTVDEILTPELDTSSYFKDTVSIKAGTTLELDIPLMGKPLPKISWKFGDKQYMGNLILYNYAD